jgi:hypothetical protein
MVRLTAENDRREHECKVGVIKVSMNGNILGIGIFSIIAVIVFFDITYKEMNYNSTVKENVCTVTDITSEWKGSLCDVTCDCNTSPWLEPFPDIIKCDSINNTFVGQCDNGVQCCEWQDTKYGKSTSSSTYRDPHCTKLVPKQICDFGCKDIYDFTIFCTVPNIDSYTRTIKDVQDNYDFNEWNMESEHKVWTDNDNMYFSDPSEWNVHAANSVYVFASFSTLCMGFYIYNRYQLYCIKKSYSLNGVQSTEVPLEDVADNDA